MTKTNQRESFLTRIRNLVAGDGGFTLLETLAVMVIVGLLAAITVPQISKWREKAYITSMKTDARNVASAIEASYVDNQTYPATTSAVVGNTTADLVTKLDVKLSGGNTLTSYTGTGNTAFSFVITSDKVSTASQDVATYTSNPAPGVANLAFS